MEYTLDSDGRYFQVNNLLKLFDIVSWKRIPDFV